MPPAISIVIPHLNDAERLGRCLAALAAQDADMARAEIIVVDNGSREPPAGLVAGVPGARLVEEATPGPGPARNRGAALAAAPVLAFTDSDCIPAPDWVATILARFAAEPGTGIIGGDVRVFAADPDRPSPAEAYDLLYAFQQRTHIARRRFSVTANLAVRREVFAAVGPFGGLEVSEDLDWGQRAAALGHATRFAPEIVVRHPARADMAALRAQWDRHTSHFYRVRAATRLGRLQWALTIPVMAASPLAEIPKILASDRIAGPWSRWQVFRGVAGLRLHRARRMLEAMQGGRARTASREWNRG
jgi:glycosyltransferase involved in cell wall biosynthesis